ncbi:MAG: PQQ-binding-like beta-propeller repeat protein [Candidatus Paceibacterota bacterium]
MNKKYLIVLVSIIILIIGGYSIYRSSHPWGGRPGGPEGMEQTQFQPNEFGQTPLKPGETPPTGPGAMSVNTDRSLPTLPEGTPKGEWVTKNLGDVEVKYFSTAIAWGMTESGTDVFITLRNKGKSSVTVNFTPVESLLSQVPKWNLHFFSLVKSPVTLGPGEEKKLWYFASLDKTGENFTVKFKIWTDTSTSLEVPIIFGAIDDWFKGQETSQIYGYVKDEKGKPLSQVEVSAQMNCGRLGFRGSTDQQGRYAISVLGKEDIDAIYQGKELGCSSTDYSLTVEKDGYEYYFKEHVNPTRKNFAQADVTLVKQKESASYTLAWEKQVSEPYGFFWTKPSSDWSVFAVSEAKHEPQLGKPTNFYLFDSLGNILWKQPTENECWGIDISPDGSKVVAGCHDEKVYMVSKEGSLLWSSDMNGMTRSACFSRDGKTVLSGTVGRLSLFNAATGAKSNISWDGGWLRNCLFYLDDSGFIAGSPEIASFDSLGNEKWLQPIGEFPMFLGVDTAKNVFAAGKSRTLFSFDASGNLRWKERIPDHVVTMGAVTPNGKRIALGTVGGMVYLFDGDGNLLWKRNMGGSTTEADFVGHNAVAISDDGTRIVAGSAPGNCVIVYNDKGTTLWKKCLETKTTNDNLRLGVTNVQISSDKTKIIASYGDNYLREFIKQ